MRKEFEDKNLSANWFCINDDARTTLYFVEMGMGVGIIPQSAATLVQKKGIVCRPVKNCDIATDVVLAYNSTYLPECSRAFIEYLDTLYPRYSISLPHAYLRFVLKYPLYTSKFV